MSSLLVPIDFSETSIHAARYATHLSMQLGIKKIVLYHSHFAETFKNSNEDHLHDDQALNELILIKNSLQSIAPDVEFITITNGGLILENIQQLSLQYVSSLIVMGITGKNKLEQKIVGSNTIKVGLNSEIPVLIIPPNANYDPMKNVILALPFKKSLIDFVPFKAINTLNEKLKANLMVVNVEKKGENIPNSIVYSGLQAAHYMFEKSGATFHMISDEHIADAITHYAISNDAQIIISIAEEHNFIEYLFKGSVTSRLAFHSNIPVLVYKPGKVSEE